MPCTRRLLVVGLVLSHLCATGAAVFAQPEGRPGESKLPASTAYNHDFWSRLLDSTKTQQELQLSNEVVMKLKEVRDAGANKFSELGDTWRQAAKLGGPERAAKAAEVRAKVGALVG